jgi:acetyl esterase/lipase
MPSFRARLLNALLRRFVKRLWQPGLSIEQIRAHTAGTDRRLSRRRIACAVEQVTIGGVPATWHGAPELATQRGTLLYLHGGAWCVHLPALYSTFAARLSNATGLRVLLVDYRLAPEHKFPASTDDCIAVYRALVETSGVPRAIAGDSAGGNLSLLTLMRARDEQLPLPGCAVLLSPATDLSLGSPSIRYNVHADPMFGGGMKDLLVPLYCPDVDLRDPRLSPLFGRWDGLPPLFFLAGSTEILLDDAVRAHDRAQQAGTDSRIDVWPDLPHVFPLFAMLPEARQALDEIASFIAQHARAGSVAAAERLAAPRGGDYPTRAGCERSQRSAMN